MKLSCAWYLRSCRDQGQTQSQEANRKPGDRVLTVRSEGTFRILPVVKFQTSMKPSTDPVTRYWPSGEKREHSTWDFCPNYMKGRKKRGGERRSNMCITVVLQKPWSSGNRYETYRTIERFGLTNLCMKNQFNQLHGITSWNAWRTLPIKINQDVLETLWDGFKSCCLECLNKWYFTSKYQHVWSV